MPFPAQTSAFCSHCSPFHSIVCLMHAFAGKIEQVMGNRKWHLQRNGFASEIGCRAMPSASIFLFPYWSHWTIDSYLKTHFRQDHRDVQICGVNIFQGCFNANKLTCDIGLFLALWSLCVEGSSGCAGIQWLPIPGQVLFVWPASFWVHAPNVQRNFTCNLVSCIGCLSYIMWDWYYDTVNLFVRNMYYLSKISLVL